LEWFDEGDWLTVEVERNEFWCSKDEMTLGGHTEVIVGVAHDLFMQSYILLDYLINGKW